MPNSVIESVNVDIVAPADELPAKLIAFLKAIPLDKNDSETESKNNGNLEKIIILIREQTGYDFSLYKEKTIFRGIERRKSFHKIDEINDYIRFLRQHPTEIQILFKECLIGVTSFFHDAEVWEMIKETILPDLINKLPDKYELRAWVSGCSTGEEAYSLAIILKEAMEKANMHKNITFRIFATDIDRDAVEKARKGVFAKNVTSNVSPERLARFFTAEGESYRVNNDIRDMLLFAAHNMIKDPPYIRLDIISCRNVIIYLGSELQSKLVELFNYCLNPDGILILGNSETLVNHNKGFTRVDANLKIFKKTTIT